MQNIDEENIEFGEVFQKMLGYNLSKLSDLADKDKTNKIQVVGHVEKKEKEDGPTIYYNVFYTFEFVEGDAEEQNEQNN